MSSQATSLIAYNGSEPNQEFQSVCSVAETWHVVFAYPTNPHEDGSTARGHQKDMLLCTVRAAGTHLPITASVHLKRYKWRSQTKCNTAGFRMDQCNSMLHHVGHTCHAPGPAGGSSLGGGQAKGALCARMTHHRVKLSNSHALALEDIPTCTGRVHYALSWILAQTSSHSEIVNRSRWSLRGGVSTPIWLSHTSEGMLSCTASMSHSCVQLPA